MERIKFVGVFPTTETSFRYSPVRSIPMSRLNTSTEYSGLSRFCSTNFKALRRNNSSAADSKELSGAASGVAFSCSFLFSCCSSNWRIFINSSSKANSFSAGDRGDRTPSESWSTSSFNSTALFCISFNCSLVLPSSVCFKMVSKGEIIRLIGSASS